MTLHLGLGPAFGNSGNIKNSGDHTVLLWTIHKTAATTTPTLLTSLLDCAISPKTQENHIIHANKMYQYPNLFKLHKPSVWS